MREIDQDWLDDKYLDKEEVTSINEKNQNFAGKLIIKDFPNLKEIDLCNNKNLAQIELINLPKLKYFKANNCHLDYIIINDCPNIENFNVGNNLLTKTDFLNDLNINSLIILSIHSNNFAKQNLDFLSGFINLRELYIDNSNEENFDQRIYNHFYGSLKPLQNLRKLEWLSIAKTDIESGIEYLSKSVKKIGCKKDWGSINDSSCAKIVSELEKTSQINGVTEKLNQEEENEPLSVRKKLTWYRLATWHQAYNILGEEEFRKKISQQNAQIWIDKEYPRWTLRENITFLSINNNNLSGNLDLKSFVNLEILNCLGNKLTNIELEKCLKLIKINCASNKFPNFEFLKSISNKEKLEILRINKNNEAKGNLNFLLSFTGLKELNIEDCQLFGSLEPIKNAKCLKKIFISRTHVGSGLEYLSDSCQELYCDYDYQFKSMKIANELSGFIKDRHYDLLKWREDKQNSKAASVIPLERLFVIRTNIKKFINKWGRKNNINKIKHPDEFNKQWILINCIQWTNRAVSVIGGSLLLVGSNQENDGYIKTGGIIAIISPFVETLTSYVSEKIYLVEKAKWDEFTNDIENLIDNYHELLGILINIKIGNLGIINLSLKVLSEKANNFLELYDKEDKNGIKNGAIDIDEITNSEARINLAIDLNKGENSKLGEIVISMNKLENNLINYLQGFNSNESRIINNHNNNFILQLP